MPTSIELSPEMMRAIIMDHYSAPRNKRQPEGEGFVSTHSASVNCIDNIDVFLKMGDDGKVAEAYWDGVACAISTASTDIVCDLLVGKTEEEAHYLLEQFTHMLHGEEYDPEPLDEALAFQNTYRQPNRIHCATIGWDALGELLKEHHHG